MKLTDRVALVTGGVNRVGREISKGLAQNGLKVVAHYRGSENKALSLIHEIRNQGGEIQTLKADFTKPAEITKLLKKTITTFGKIDFLVNNAAVYYPTPIESITIGQWDEIFDVNLRAPFFCAQKAAENMAQNGEGKIINISDVSAYSPWPNFVPYCTSKAALIAMTKGLALALAPKIQVNAIASGTVLMSENASAEYAKAVEKKTLLKRIGNPEDIVETVLFLLKNDYITGSVIPVDGGALLAG